MLVNDVLTVCNLCAVYSHSHLTFKHSHHEVIQHMCVLVMVSQHECVLMWSIAARVCWLWFSCSTSVCCHDQLQHECVLVEDFVATRVCVVIVN